MEKQAERTRVLPGDFCRRKEGKGEILEEQAGYSEVREAATGKLEGGEKRGMTALYPGIFFITL